MSPANEHAVITIVRDFLDAVARGDRKAIRMHHADDILMYDFPDTVRGIAEYDRTWDFFFDSQRGPITFAPSELKASAGEDVAFVTCEVHCEGTTAGPLDFRLTVGLEKRGSDWVIAHEHHSLPTREEALVMPEKREALLPEAGSHQAVPTARTFNRITKYVATRKGVDLTWKGSVVLRDAAKDIAKLKQEDGPALVTHGSTEVVHALLAAGLVDEIRLFRFPILLGMGKRLFSENSEPRASNSHIAPSPQVG